MLTEEKTNEAKAMLRKGIPQGEIIEMLKQEGYSEEEISKLFVAHKYDMRSWYLVFGTIFLLAGLYMIIKYESYLVLIFAVLMCIQYAREMKRLNQN